MDIQTKYLLTPYLSLLFALMGLYLNAGKILFTVVYIPLTFFCLMKAASLLVCLAVRVLWLGA